MPSETRWVIVGNAGLYTGQYLRRADAITDHLSAYYSVPKWPPLTDQHRELWRKRRENGDRCVKATITWDEP